MSQYAPPYGLMLHRLTVLILMVGAVLLTDIVLVVVLLVLIEHLSAIDDRLVQLSALVEQH